MTGWRDAHAGPAWEAALARARRRRERSRRNPWNRLVHWRHARRHPEVHARMCSLCKGAE